MENQHRKIKGYRELSQVEIDLMNKIKEQDLALKALVKDVQEHLARQRKTCDEKQDLEELDRIAEAEPARWAALARTNLQTGLMELARSVAQPGFF